MEPKEHREDIDLSKYWAVLKRRWFPASGVFALTLLSAALLTALTEPVYRASAKLLIETDRSSTLTGLTSQQDAGELESLSSKSEPLTTQAEIIKSPPVAEATVAALDIRNEQGNLVSPWSILGDLVVRPVAGADVLEISYESPDPVLAAAVVNQIVEDYQDKNVEMNKAEAAAAREFILAELPKTELRLFEAEAALRQFKEENNILVLSEEASAAVSTLTNLDQNITATRTELEDISAQAAGLRNRVGMSSDQAIAMSTLSQAPGVQEALVQLQTVQSELSAERARFRPGHPAIAELEREEASLSALLDERIQQVLGRSETVSPGNLQLGDLKQGLISDFVRLEIQRIGLNRRLGELLAAQNSLQGRSRKLPSLEENLRQLERQLEASQTTYETLLSRLQEIQVAENQSIGNSQLISEAVPPGNPVSPNKKLNMAAGGVVGTFLAIAAAFLIDLLDRSIKTIKDARRAFGYPLLGIIPAYDRKTDQRTLDEATEGEPLTPHVVVIDMPQSPISSAFQMLQANLNVSSSGGTIQTLVVSSTVSGEGKSEVSANLAAAAAQAGQRVLLIDADLRNPSQHHFWNLANMVGLSNALVAQTPLKQAITPLLPNLHILTAGVIPPNTIALLSSQRMEQLLQAAKTRYDLVILDTPALAGAADAITLGKVADGLLMVVRPGRLDRVQAKYARDLLDQAGQTVLGMVANGVIVKNEPESYFYFQGTPPTPSPRGNSNSSGLTVHSSSARTNGHPATPPVS
ncbi:MAG: polysaccharide biosynthesis tyrosine autokinase [Leptolyngbyaceae bacterium]|nr:polysaccharide biosynthesis tyrosine autokinase [Leptolyngbyaceae bacterium]